MSSWTLYSRFLRLLWVDIHQLIPANAQTELLLDRLVLVCSRVVIRHCTAFNAATLAAEAAFYQATTLKLSIYDYIIASMETMLESGLLDEIDEDVLGDLSSVINDKQKRKLPVTKGEALVKTILEKHKDWVQLQDFPSPRVRQPYKVRARSPMLSPVDGRFKMPTSPDACPALPPASNLDNDDIFSMDEEALRPSPHSSGMTTPKMSRPVTPLETVSSTVAKGPVWKSKTIETER